MKEKTKTWLTPLSAGIFIGVALFDAFPHSIEKLGKLAFVWIGVGVLLWWLQKKILHKMKKPDTPVLVTTALWLHSLVEGLVTGLAFGISQTFGIAVAAGMILHLLPEFFAAIAILQGSGADKEKSAWVPLVGYVILFISFYITYQFLQQLGGIADILGAISGGAFVYVGYRILKKEKYRTKTSIISAIVGILLSGVFVWVV